MWGFVLVKRSAWVRSAELVEIIRRICNRVRRKASKQGLAPDQDTFYTKLRNSPRISDKAREKCRNGGRVYVLQTARVRKIVISLSELLIDFSLSQLSLYISQLSLSPVQSTKYLMSHLSFVMDRTREHQEEASKQKTVFCQWYHYYNPIIDDDPGPNVNV